MDRYAPHLAWIDAQHARLCRLVASWANINSGTYHVAGVERCADAISAEFASLGGDLRRVDLPPHAGVDGSGETVGRPLGRAIHIVKRPDAALRVLLAIHCDTVYGADDPFQSVTPIDEHTLRGPGVADAKGGLVVMLAALEAFERSPFAAGIGWEVIINPDEEIGSPGSSTLFAEAARRNSLGLLFEPALPDGSLVGARKGSGTFTAVSTGRAAHVGRNPQDGRNAIHALAQFVVVLSAKIHRPDDGIIANVGRIEGGTVANVVPDRAVCQFNVRVSTAAQQKQVEARLAELASELNARDGFDFRLHGGFASPPKPLEPCGLRLLEHIASCGRELGLSLGWRDTGGACDGNRLAAAGLPNVDSLGPVGGNLHSPGEYVRLDSLTERAKLTALLLMRLGSGELTWPAGGAVQEVV